MRLDTPFHRPKALGLIEPHGGAVAFEYAQAIYNNPDLPGASLSAANELSVVVSTGEDGQIGFVHCVDQSVGIIDAT